MCADGQGSKWGKRSTSMTHSLPFPLFPSRPLPFPSPPSLCFPPLSLEVGPLNPATGSGEHCKLPQRGPGRSPGHKRIFGTFCAQETHLDATVLMIFLTTNWPVWQSARKKWRYDFKPTKEIPVTGILYHTGAYHLTSSPVDRKHFTVYFSTSLFFIFAV